MSLGQFVVRRLLRLCFVVAMLVVVTFFLVSLVPGDPARIIAGLHANQQQLDSIREQFHLDRSMPSQFWHYVVGLAHGDLGTSYANSQPVSTIVRNSAGPSAQLALLSMVFITTIGAVVGFGGAVLTDRGRNWLEPIISATTGTMTALPSYLIATVLVFFFAIQWPLFPVAGDADVRALILPALAISIGSAGLVARLLRVKTLDVLEQPYIQAARSKRLSPWKLYSRHVFPNAITTALSSAGLIFAGLIGGAVVAEQVFARRGLGTELVHAVTVHDYPVVIGITLFIGVSVVIVNAVVDILLGVVDPRTREAAQ